MQAGQIEELRFTVCFTSGKPTFVNEQTLKLLKEHFVELRGLSLQGVDMRGWDQDPATYLNMVNLGSLNLYCCELTDASVQNVKEIAGFQNFTQTGCDYDDELIQWRHIRHGVVEATPTPVFRFARCHVRGELWVGKHGY